MEAANLTLRINTEGMDSAQRGMEGLTKTGEYLEKTINRVVAAFLSWKGAEWARDVVMLGARYETLGVAMTVVGHNAGYTSAQMAQFQDALQRTGISMIESRNNLARMAAAQLDLSKSSELARVAQDAAVIAGVNSSQAFESIVQGIVSGQPRILHTLGIFANFSAAEKAWADAHQRTAESLSVAEKVGIRMNEVLFEGAKRAGAYAASMDTAGKQIFSMQRYIEDLEVKLGSIFGPALQKMVFDLVDKLHLMSAALDDMQKSGQLLRLMNGLRDTIGSVVGPIFTLTKAIWDHRDAILLLAGAYAAVKLGITISGWTTAVQEWVAAQKIALAAMASYSAASGEMAVASTAATVATKGMTAAMAALGGPIGILIALLGAAAVAFMIFRDKTSEDARKSGKNIEEETAALNKKIQKQKEYWELVARGATPDQASKALRPTADDDPGIRDLDAKYGALQARLAEYGQQWNAAWMSAHAKTGFADGESLISPQVLDLQRQMNDLLAQRQKFVEAFNVAQHGSDLIEENQMKSARAVADATADAAKAAGDLYEINHRIYGVDKVSALGRERTVPDSLLAPEAMKSETFHFQKLDDSLTALMKKMAQAADEGDAFAAMGYEIAASSGHASDAMATWISNTDGLGRSWTTLGNTVRNVLADMIRQMERAIIQQKLMDPLLQWAGTTLFRLGQPTPVASGAGAGISAFASGFTQMASPVSAKASIVVNVSSDTAAKATSQDAGKAGTDLAQMMEPVINAWAIKQSRSGGYFARG